MSLINRRRHERFAVEPMYTGVAVRPLEEDAFRLLGHAYDVSEGGVCLELDVPLEPGQAVAVRLDLPRWWEGDPGPGRAIFAIGNVVWCDTEEPGPARQAIAFTRFCRAGDRERLLAALGRAGVRRMAA